MMVCKIAQLSNYGKVVQIAALLHDIGKPASRKINPRNNHVQFFRHEKFSAEMALDVLELMMREDIIDVGEKKEIIELIIHHAILYKYSEANEILEYFDRDKIFCRHIIQLVKCDSLGRFCPDLSSEEKFQVLLEEIESF
jgi:putative nucleotidyltransferase with HDIG domain